MLNAHHQKSNKQFFEKIQKQKKITKISKINHYIYIK